MQNRCGLTTLPTAALGTSLDRLKLMSRSVEREIHCLKTLSLEKSLNYR